MSALMENNTQIVTPSCLTSFDVDIGESRPHFPSPVRDFDINWLTVKTSPSLPRRIDTVAVQSIPAVHAALCSASPHSSASLHTLPKLLLRPVPPTLLPAYRLARPSSAPPAESPFSGSFHRGVQANELAREVRDSSVFIMINPRDMLSIDVTRIRCLPSPIPKVFGPTSFTVWASQWEQLTIYTWLRKLFHSPYPETILTICAHFVDASGAVPGVRVGSDLRVYHGTLTQKVAVLDWVSISGKWGFFAVFVYGNSSGHAPEIEEKMGILVVPLELVEVEEDEDYEDEILLRERGVIVQWDYLGEEFRHGVALAFPEGHRRSVVKCITDEVPLDLTPQYLVKRSSSGTDFSPI